MTVRFVPLAAVALLLASAASRGQGDVPPALFPGAAECAARLQRAGVLPESGVAETGPDRVGPAPSEHEKGTDPNEAPTAYYAGAERVAELCPDLEAAMAGPSGTALLVGGAAAPLTPAVVVDTAELSARYARAAAGEPALSAAGLAATVEALQPFTPAPTLSMWDRIAEWLRDLLAPGDDADGGFWDWLHVIAIPDSWIPWSIRVIGIATVLAVLAVAANELRHAGVFSRGAPRREPRGRGAGAGAAATRSIDWRRAPPRRRPALLLAAIVDHLRARGASMLRDNLTHRELIGAAGMLSAAQRSSFEVVASAAERTAFGGWQPHAADVEAVLMRGEALLEELSVEADAAAR